MTGAGNEVVSEEWGKIRMRRKVMVCLLTLAVMVSFMPATAFAATKSMTVYTEVLKTGNTVYCCSFKGMYKVRIKNGRPVSKKLIVKSSEKKGYPHGMKKKGKYLYYSLNAGESDDSPLYRINLSSGKKQKLAKDVSDYVICGNNLYYNYYGKADEFGEQPLITKVMKLNGKCKTSTNITIHNRSKLSNAKGYKITYKDITGKYNVKEYLKTPKGRIYLCRY